MAKGLGYGIFLFCRNTLGWDVYDFFDLFVCLIALGAVLSGVFWAAFKIALYFHPEWDPKNNKNNTSDNVNIQANIASETVQPTETKDIQQMYMEAKAKIRNDQKSASNNANPEGAGQISSNTKDIQKIYMATKAKINKDAETATREVASVKKFCSNCGAQIGQNDRFCHACGVELNSIT